MLGETLGAAAPSTLDALQFPYRANDVWLGSRFPDTFRDGTPFALTEDKLLYSAHFAADGEIDVTQPNLSYSAVLLDEWIEVVPGDVAATGVTFHFDRPNSEAPQTILLVTPPTYKGEWQWLDLVDTLHETLDFARLRAVDPAQLDQTALATLIPALLSSVTTFPITPTLNLAFNNNVHVLMAEGAT